MDSLRVHDLWKIETSWKGKSLIVKLCVDVVHLFGYNKREYTRSCHYIHFKVYKMDIYWKRDWKIFLTGYYLWQLLSV
jgi:hypothetical protein